VDLGLQGGKSRDEREEEKDDMEPYESDVSAELNEKPELEIIDARELDREIVAARVLGEVRRDELEIEEEEGTGIPGNWSSKGAIQVEDMVVEGYDGPEGEGLEKETS